MSKGLQHGGHDLPVRGGNDRRQQAHDKPKSAQEMHAAALRDMSVQAKATLQAAKTQVPANHQDVRAGLTHGGGHHTQPVSAGNPGQTPYGTMPLPPGAPKQDGFDTSVPSPVDPINARPSLTHNGGHYTRHPAKQRYMPLVRASISHSSEKSGHKAGRGGMIASAIKRPGALTAAVGGKPGQNLGKTRQLAASGSTRTKREAQFYLNVLRRK